VLRIREDIEFPINISSTSEGNITISDILFQYNPGEEIPIRIDARTVSNTSTYWANMVHSKFNLSYVPDNVEYLDIYPLWGNQKDVQPWGQDQRVPILEINKSPDVNHTFDLRVKIEEGTSNDCIQMYISQDRFKNNGFLIQEGTYNSLGLFGDSVVNDGTSLWLYTDFNYCSTEQMKTFYPNLVFKSKAEGTVNTTGFWDE